MNVIYWLLILGNDGLEIPVVEFQVTKIEHA